ncbi:hypothetical protein OCU04_001535 [Sclerotinia nivalis]|uniref:Uncharacterized protein n=1 Tax=Sclerotinia nivalis TaxID=352851 RepID=A0A9X0AYC2_9HELO|nr:hypothetical protein OCU04_001535 [Sclerotinia nivalis]
MNQPRRRTAHQRADRAIRRLRQEETAEMKIDEWITEQNLMRIPLFPDTMHPALLQMEVECDLQLFQHHLRVAEDIRAARLQVEVDSHKHRLEMAEVDRVALLGERYLRLRASIALLFLYSFAAIFGLYALGYVALNPSSLAVLFNRILEAYSSEF